jgi:hypothetical protein
MSRDVAERAGEFGVDVETYRAAVDTSFERWAEMTGDSRPLSELPLGLALGRVGCVAGLVLPEVIDEMTGRSRSAEQEPTFEFGALPAKYEDPTERHLAVYQRKADEYAKANPDSQQNPFDDIVRGVRNGTLSFEN